MSKILYMTKFSPLLYNYIYLTENMHDAIVMLQKKAGTQFTRETYRELRNEMEKKFDDAHTINTMQKIVSETFTIDEESQQAIQKSMSSLDSSVGDAIKETITKLVEAIGEPLWDFIESRLNHIYTDKQLAAMVLWSAHGDDMCRNISMPGTEYSEVFLSETSLYMPFPTRLNDSNYSSIQLEGILINFLLLVQNYLLHLHI